MGWFSKKKKGKKTESIKTKAESFSACPVCGDKIFVKVTTYLYSGEPETVGDMNIVTENEADCSRFTGDQTGYCQKCGGIAHGWIFAEPAHNLSPMVIQHFNQTFLYAVNRMNKEVNSGKSANRFEAINRTVIEIKEQSAGVGLIADFAVGYYLLILLFENDVIGFNDPLVFSMLKVERSISDTTHEKLKSLMQNNFQQFFR